MPGPSDVLKLYAPFAIAMLAAVGVGAIIGYFFSKKNEMPSEEMASVLAKRAKENPSVLQPITSVYQYMMNERGLTYFPGPKNGAPGFFATPFKPSLNGAVAHVVCKQGGELFYLMSIKNCVLDNDTREDVADLPSGLLNSGNASELARTQSIIKKIGDDRQRTPDMSYEQYKASMLKYSQSFDPKSTVAIDATLDEGVRRECAEKTGVSLQEPGLFLNILNINRGSKLIAHLLYPIESESLPQLKPQAEEETSKNVWVNINDIHLSITSSGEHQGYAVIDKKQYKIKPYDLIAEHIHKVLNEITPSDENIFSLSTHYDNTRYEPRVVR